MKHSQKIFMVVLAALLLGGCLTVRLPGAHIEHNAEPKPLNWNALVGQTITLNRPTWAEYSHADRDAAGAFE